MTSKLDRKLKELGDIYHRSRNSNVTSDYSKIRSSSEKAALKKGYSLDEDSLCFYEDCYLQEAWEMFSLIDLRSCIRKKPYKEFVTLKDIIEDGWSRGFQVEQTVEEANIMGFLVDNIQVTEAWGKLTDTYNKHLKDSKQ